MTWSFTLAFLIVNIDTIGAFVVAHADRHIDFNRHLKS